VHLYPPLLVGLHIRALAHGDDKHGLGLGVVFMLFGFGLGLGVVFMLFGFGLGLGVVFMLFVFGLVCSCLAVVWRVVVTFLKFFLASSNAIGVNEKAQLEP
jgi:hypothetical protein